MNGSADDTLLTHLRCNKTNQTQATVKKTMLNDKTAFAVCYTKSMGRLKGCSTDSTATISVLG